MCLRIGLYAKLAAAEPKVPSVWRTTLSVPTIETINNQRYQRHDSHANFVRKYFLQKLGKIATRFECMAMPMNWKTDARNVIWLSSRWAKWKSIKWVAKYVHINATSVKKYEPDIQGFQRHMRACVPAYSKKVVQIENKEGLNVSWIRLENSDELNLFELIFIAYFILVSKGSTSFSHLR